MEMDMSVPETGDVDDIPAASDEVAGTDAPEVRAKQLLLFPDLEPKEGTDALRHRLWYADHLSRLCGHTVPIRPLSISNKVFSVLNRLKYEIVYRPDSGTVPWQQLTRGAGFGDHWIVTHDCLIETATDGHWFLFPRYSRAPITHLDEIAIPPPLDPTFEEFVLAIAHTRARRAIKLREPYWACRYVPLRSFCNLLGRQQAMYAGWYDGNTIDVIASTRASIAPEFLLSRATIMLPNG
jgi:hypothetical protein